MIIDPRFDSRWSGSMFLVDIETGKSTHLVSNAWSNTDLSGGESPSFQLHAHPVWSPDGSQILYAARTCKDCAGDSEVFAVFVE